MERFVVAAAVCLIVGLASTPAPTAAQSLRRGPYLQSVTRASVVVVADLDAHGTPEVRITTPTGASLAFPSTRHRRHHEITVDGLVPNAAYAYELRLGGERLAGPHRFRTAPEPGTAFRFIAFGDTRSHADDHTAVLEAMRTEPDVGFYVNSGDLVADGASSAQWDEFFAIEAPWIAEVPFFPVIGNHDKGTGWATQYLDQFVVPRNAPDPEAYYSFDYGNTHVVVLDGWVHTQLMCWRDPIFGCFSDAQVRWLERDLANARARPEIRHVFVITHEGPYSSKSGRRGSAQMRALLGLFRDHEVTMLVSGHDHYFERGVSGNGIPYLITGGGGAPLYEISRPSPDRHRVDANASENHYVLFDVDGDFVYAQAKTVGGDALDEWEVRPELADWPADAWGPAPGPGPRAATGGELDAPGCAVSPRPAASAAWALVLLGAVTRWARRRGRGRARSP